MTVQSDSLAGFERLGLPAFVLEALGEIGFETPTPIQSRTIPHILEGRDLLGQAQTGTGKTAAFALPILSMIDPGSSCVQALVLVPTRELAMQVSKDFGKYASGIPGLSVLPIYGGQEYGPQLRALKRGVHVVVGTPGRVMDHLRKGTLSLDHLSFMVLDEADEMLRMGFIDDVDWILEKTPEDRQTTLFSATMPKPIRSIAKRHLNDPLEVIIETGTTAAKSIRQRYLVATPKRKSEALWRVVESEETEGVLVFVKTKVATAEVADTLKKRGFRARALNGDLSQASRERIVDQLKKGEIDIVVATDVAARGLDVDRISHVINYDAPFDAETYVHRIGRTGRAGRSGEAILFLEPREKRVLRGIGRETGQAIEHMEVPSVESLNRKRIDNLKGKLAQQLATGDLDFFKTLIEDYYEEHDFSQVDIAAALACVLQGDQSLLLCEQGLSDESASFWEDRGKKAKGASKRAKPRPLEEGMVRYVLDVGAAHGVQPSNIVGAIANEGDIDSRYIGGITIYENNSTVDLPDGMPKRVLQTLKKAWVCGCRLNTRREKADGKNSSDEGKSVAKTSSKRQKGRSKKSKKTKKPAKALRREKTRALSGMNAA